ncbi:hypothetical protein [Amycolatopsis nigrescens]|uniref:hypothetical protein n=1 Tax=Amycolatopsis nigrescens TaxID=381445 RepID=UPI00036AF976|nr:hypothetical protein [Amycolatopsis nigrescens]
MAEQNEKTGKSVPKGPTARQLTAARKFIERHGGTAKGVVENIGLAGARVVLVGADGALGDVVVSGVDAGNALVEQVGGLEAAEWDAETVNGTEIGVAHRHRMAAPPPLPVPKPPQRFPIPRP